MTAAAAAITTTNTTVLLERANLQSSSLITKLSRGLFLFCYE